MTSPCRNRDNGANFVSDQPSASTKRIMHVAAIPPQVLMTKLDEFRDAIDVSEWKNIALPVCDTTNGIVEAIDLLKRFVLILDNRFEKLITSYSTSANDANLKLDSF